MRYQSQQGPGKREYRCLGQWAVENPQQSQNMVIFIRTLMKSKFSAEFAQNCRSAVAQGFLEILIRHFSGGQCFLRARQDTMAENLQLWKKNSILSSSSLYFTARRSHPSTQVRHRLHLAGSHWMPPSRECILARVPSDTHPIAIFLTAPPNPQAPCPLTLTENNEDVGIEQVNPYLERCQMI